VTSPLGVSYDVLCVFLFWQTIFLMDWYYDNTKGLLSNVPGWVAPDALLMNGGNYFPGCPKTKPFKLLVKPRRWYRLQVINSALFTAFSFAVQVRREVPLFS